MKHDKILSELKKHDWWVEECPGTHQACEWAWIGFSESSKYFDPRRLSLGFYFYKNDFVSEITPRDEKIEQFYFALKKYQQNKNYLALKRKQWEKIVNGMLKDGWSLCKNIDCLSRQEIKDKYKNFVQLLTEQAKFSAFIECVDPYSEEELKETFTKSVPSVKESSSQKIITTLCLPQNLSFMDEERIDFLKACLEAKKNPASIKETSKVLEDKYIWMLTHYGQALPKTRLRFAQETRRHLLESNESEIKKEIRKLTNKPKKISAEKKSLIKKYNIPSRLTEVFSLISEMGDWIDARKSCAMQATFIIFKVLDKLKDVLHCPAHLLAYATYDEMVKWLDSDMEKISRKELRKRQKFSLFAVRLISPGKAKSEFIFGPEAKFIYNNLLKVKDHSELKGMTTFRANGAITGKASVVLNSTKDKFNQGDILVTSMTRPDFLPLMRKAKAIITDEGGLTCHAAILSRELRIPCIIGTKVATKVLHDGDLVEMDTEKGVVKILKQKSKTNI